MNAGVGGDCEDRALEALIASAFCRDDRVEEDVDLGRLPQLIEEKERSLGSLGSDFVQRLVRGDAVQREAGAPAKPRWSEEVVFAGGTPRLPVGVSNNHLFQRLNSMILTHKRLSAAAAATVMALTAGLILCVSLSSSSSPAYALDQTAQANNRITSYHVKITPPVELGELWVELNLDGSILRARMDLFSPYDGPKVSIVSKDKAEVWFKMKHSHVITGDRPKIDRALKEVAQTRELFDPKLAFEQVQAAEKAGKVHVETREPAQEGQPIRLTVTSKATPDRQRVFDVDPQTKLVQQLTELHRKDDRWQVASVCEYLEYNKEFAPNVFKLELPKGTMTIDQIKTKVGMEKANLTDEEIATKVAKEFVEAIIAGDYEKASPLYSGIPADRLRKTMGPARFLRIVEIGKPTPHPFTGSLKVPVKVEMEPSGEKTIKELTPYVRPQEGGRWTICGGM